MVDFYMRIGSEAGVPLLIYYIPGVNAVTFTDEQFDRLLNIDHVVGIKFSDYDLFLMQQIMARHPDTVVLSGNDQVFLPALSVGAHGAVGLTLNIMPSLYVELYRAFSSGDLKTAQELQYKANRVISIVVAHNPMAALKPIMKMMGFDCGLPRAPLPELDRSTIARIRAQLTEIDFFSDPIYTEWAKGCPPGDR
jgi:N-acetylneuraminate lyase